MSNNKRSGGNSIALKIYAVITSLLIAASAVVVGVGFGTGRWQVTPKDETPAVEQPDEEQPADEGGMQIGESEGSGISLMSAKIAPANYADYGISPMAESAQQLTATITPANATNKQVDWAIAWVNPSSSWASGKTVTDYVTVTPTSDGSLTANVECKQAFGEQVKITCTSRQNAEASASSTVDYAKRITTINRSKTSGGSVIFSMTAAGSSHLIGKGEAILDTASEFVPVYSIGTIDDEFEFAYTYSYSTEFISALEEQGFTDLSDANVDVSLPEDSTMSYFGGSAPGCGAVGKDAFGVQMDAMFGTSGLYNKFTAALRSMGDNPIYTIKAVATGTYSSVTATCKFTVSAANYNILVQSVGGLGNLVF